MKRSTESSTLLAGDIGGTKTILAVFSSEAGPRAPLAEATFPSAHYPSLEALVGQFLTGVGPPVGRASFAVAGPVVSGQARITNLPWVIDEPQLHVALGLASVRLLNDLEAVAHAVPFLEPSDCDTLHQAEPASGGAIGVIAPGTGLGEAFLTWDGSGYHAHASEGGHADFAPTSPMEIELLRYLLARFGHVSYERLCSGQGLPHTYAFLKEIGFASEPAWLAEQLAAVEDPNPVIIRAAFETSPPCELCMAALNTFVSILGAEAGNLALKVLATGGIYLGGGISPRILPALKHERFLHAFRSKGRLSELLARIPVHVILNPSIALLGAACHGLQSEE